MNQPAKPVFETQASGAGTEGGMAFISVTRLRVRSVRFMPAFAFFTSRSTQQVRRAEGFLGGALLADRRWAFWTLTRWACQQDMRSYMTGGSHKRAMPYLLDWCDEASVVHWHEPGPQLPTWEYAAQRMREQGRVSKVRHPSPQHATLSFAKPRLSYGGPIQPLPGSRATPHR